MRVLNGNSAVAEAVKQVHPDVVVGYPITPSTPILEEIAASVANGQIDTELIDVESDHSAISACIGASAAGGRVFSATASQGLALMHEILFIASSYRLPLVVAVGNRALSAPMNFHTDHSDSMAQRDCGWIQLFSETPQEAYDNTIQAFKIAEHTDVKTPVMVCMDGIITTHTDTNVLVEKNSEINEFVGKCSPDYSVLDNEKPVTVGNVAGPDYYFEQKFNQAQGIENARRIIKAIGKEYGDRFGRYYGHFESYKMDDAEQAILIIGSAAGTVKELVDELRKKGDKVGLLKLRVFRPFPYKELKDCLSHVKAIAVLDRTFSPGSYGGPLFNETRSALYDLEKKPMIFPYIYGLGGRDITMEHFQQVFEDLERKCSEPLETDSETVYINLRNTK